MISLYTQAWLAVGLLAQWTAAQQISPTSNFTSPDTSGTQIGLVLGSSPSPVPSAMPILLDPLTSAAAANIPSAGLTGPAYLINMTTVSSSVANGLAFVQCDSNPSNDPTTILQNVVQAGPPQMVILFSNTSAYCNYTPGTFIQRYGSIWTMISAANGQAVQAALSTAAINRQQIFATILTPSQRSTNGTGPGPNNPASSSTAVAMIILYSITGVITALFLIIIVTGAIRAHRHPERYGPRTLMGRARQSRARGLGRAILDTLPIVKFGEQEGESKPEGEGGDMEMAGPSMTEASGTGQATETTHLNRGSAGSEDLSPNSPGIHTVLHSGSEPAAPVENPGCSICTDDFERGQDVRVLPCGHQFHPACIDPWLLNVSGTCPLCRVDLRPGTAQSHHTTTSNFLDNIAENENGGPRRDSFAPPLEEGAAVTAAAASNPRSSRRVSVLIGSILNPRRMQDASTDERIAALRRARDQRVSQGEDEMEARRSRRLTARLQDTFHIRTRARSGSREGRDTPEEDRNNSGRRFSSLRPHGLRRSTQGTGTVGNDQLGQIAEPLAVHHATASDPLMTAGEANTYGRP